ncbi:MAG: hypothetical protein IIU28_08740 [Lachnospiraceae bacterium]|nr:hypothetical protein [Lachnospiraceae bacterium]
MRREKRRYSPFRYYRLNIILGILIFFLGIAVFSVFVCRVDKFTVEGNNVASEQEVMNASLVEKYKNNGLFDVLYAKFYPARDIEFVSKVRVHMRGFHEVVLSVKEKNLVFYTRDDKDHFIYCDKNANVTQVSTRLVSGITPILGLEVKSEKVKEGQILPVAGNRINALKVLLKNKKSRKIAMDSIVFTEEGNILVTSGDIKVKLGNRSGLEEKLRRLAYILPMLKGKKGTLHLEDFSENNTDIVFDSKKKTG